MYFAFLCLFSSCNLFIFCIKTACIGLSFCMFSACILPVCCFYSACSPLVVFLHYACSYRYPDYTSLLFCRLLSVPFMYPTSTLPILFWYSNIFCLSSTYIRLVFCLFSAYALPILILYSKILCLSSTYIRLVFCLFSAYALPILCLYSICTLTVVCLFSQMPNKWRDPNKRGGGSWNLRKCCK